MTLRKSALLAIAISSIMANLGSSHVEPSSPFDGPPTRQPKDEADAKMAAAEEKRRRKNAKRAKARGAKT